MIFFVKFQILFFDMDLILEYHEVEFQFSDVCGKRYTQKMFWKKVINVIK